MHLGGNTAAFDVLRWFLPGLAWGWDMKGTVTSDAHALGISKLRRLARATLKKLELMQDDASAQNEATTGECFVFIVLLPWRSHCVLLSKPRHAL